MFKKQDPHSFTKYFNLTITDTSNPNSPQQEPIGYLIANYNVSQYDDVEIQNKNSFISNNKKKFIINCTQRIVIYNQDNLTLSPIDLTQDSNYPYENYPALIQVNLTLSSSVKNPSSWFSIQLLDYSPKTINTKVQTSGSSGIGTSTGQSSSISNTVGSSTSQTNSYSTSVGMDAGIVGDVFSFGGNVSSTTENSTTTTQESSNTRDSGTSNSSNRDSSSANSMSIKDWGAYAIINPLTQTPTWYFGQEYPWDAILCRLTNTTKNPNPKNTNASNQTCLILPEDMNNRLFDGKILYPPSQLSMFGFNFVTKNSWLVTVDYNQLEAISDIVLNHEISYYSASHSANQNQVSVYIDKTPCILQTDSQNGNIETDLNLSFMSLDVLGQKSPSIIGFIPKQFMVNPSSNPFKIISTSNNLFIEDSTNYGNPVNYPAQPLFISDQNALTVKSQKQTASMSLYFKVIDVSNDYTLYMKHWIVGNKEVKLTININNSYTITKYLTSIEAQGGENNLLAISLRKQTFSSVDYHDYLELGLNLIEITIEASDGQDFNYQLRALSIEAE